MFRSLTTTITQPITNLLFLRHAESTFNKACQLQSQKLQIDTLPWNQQMQNQQFCTKVCYNQKYMDCSICQDGVLQSQKVKEIIFGGMGMGMGVGRQGSQGIGLVLVSPYMRALETCQIVFGGSNVPVIVEPLLAQSCRFSCDILPKTSLPQKLQKFPKFNFNRVPKATPLAYSIPPQKHPHLQKTLESLPQNCHLPYLMQQIRNKNLYESDTELRERAWAIKLKLREYGDMMRKEGKRGSVCVVSHWYTLAAVLSRRFGEDGENLEYEDLGNCGMYRCDIDDLMSVR